MALEERTRPYETLIRHNDDGTISAHHQKIAEVVRDGTEIVSARVLDPEPLAIASEGDDALGKLLGDALVSADAEAQRLRVQVGALEADNERLRQALEAAVWQPTPVPDDSVPQTVTRFQARAALLNAGLLDAVNAYFDRDDIDALHRLAWVEAPTINRASPALAGAAGALGLTESDIDGLFVAASQVA